MKIIGILSIIFIILISCSSSDDSSNNLDDDNPPIAETIDWSSYRGDIGNTCYSTSMLPNEEPELLWTRGVSYIDYNLKSLTVNNGVVVISDTNSIEAFNIDSGVLLWSMTELNAFPKKAISENNILVYVRNNTVFGADIQTGGTIWSYQLNSELTSEPLISNEALFFCNEQNLLSLDTSNGTLNWVKDLDINLYNPVLASDANAVYLTGGNFNSGSGGKLFAVNKSTSDIIWELSSLGTNLSTVIVVKDDNLFYSSSNTLVCLNKTTQAIKWQKLFNPDGVGGDPLLAVNGSNVFKMSDYGQKISKININTGEIIDTISLNPQDGNYLTPIISNDKLIYITNDLVVARDISNFDTLWNVGGELGFFAGVAPIVADNKLLFMSENVVDGARLHVYN